MNTAGASGLTTRCTCRRAGGEGAWGIPVRAPQVSGSVRRHRGTMRALIYPFLWLSGLGFVLSLFVHLCSLGGTPLPFGRSTWLLHVGIFVVWIPAVVLSRRLTREAKTKGSWQVIYAGCPTWMKTVLYVVVVYSMINFALFAAGDKPARSDVSLVPPTVTRGFSGYWLMFYWVAVCIFYSGLHGGAGSKVCPAGHHVPSTAVYCETCGTYVGPQFDPGARDA